MNCDRRKTTRVIGIVLFVLSWVLWILIPCVYLFSISVWWKATIGGTLFIAAEIAFWVGSVLLGKEFLEKIRKIPSIKDWFKKLFFWRSKTGVG